ncbi:RNA-binding protein 47-like [Agrilus planipennis]|uniref:Probable RNA-binding protein 46 n=1 Tax=Agrilus planipennis TaxID=224129 RepID=A0A1W4XH22_AGRPL|nr:RNA-binding protein 47-like [Agrilus planipennis]
MALISSKIKFNSSEKEIIRENAVYDNLKRLSEATGYSISQRNGQRVYGPPPNWEGGKPQRGSEIFVGKIPRDIFEDELVPLFEQVGKIYELRLMMDFSGFNRGFCFVTYCDIKSADNAVKRFDGYLLRPQRKLGVYKSVDNCRLFIGGLPRDKKKEEITQAINEQVEGIMDVILYPSQYDNNENRGFAFVEFENHRYAAMARRQLAPGSFQLWGADIVVDWADPLPTLDPSVMAQVTNLYIRNICVFMDTQTFLNAILVYIPAIRIHKIHKVLDYAFVHFRRRADAEIALNALNGVSIGGHKIEVTWARPKIYSKNYRMNTPPTNFCT